jgi:endonuclease/exonuclease/phosphatase family metal-dependent hydrolase
MKLITLNTWGGILNESLLNFIRNHSEDTEVFCFQEILKDGKGKTATNENKNLYSDISNILSSYNGYFSEYQETNYKKDKKEEKIGIATFVRNDLNSNFVEAISLYHNRKWNDYSGKFLGGVALMVRVNDLHILNVHGLWQESIKTDTEAKIEQSREILEFTDKYKGKKIICGDFNLLPDTKSIQMFRDIYQDLIEEYKIETTRSISYANKLKYADFIFLDKTLKVKDFKVPRLNISDHLPLLLEFN